MPEGETRVAISFKGKTNQNLIYTKMKGINNKIHVKVIMPANTIWKSQEKRQIIINQLNSYRYTRNSEKNNKHLIKFTYLGT